MTRPGYFPATSVVLVDPQSESSRRVLNMVIIAEKKTFY